MNMKTLHFCMSRGWGGLEMASAQWASLFIKHGSEALSMCAPGSPLETRLKEMGLPYVARDFREYFSPINTLWLRRYVIENRIEGVFLQNLRDLWVVSPALWGLDVQLIGFAQMWLSGISKKDPLHQLMHSRLTTLVTLTAAHSEQTLKCLPVPPTKAVVLPNSIDTSRFGPERRSENLRNEFGASVHDYLIGIVGRLDRQKGQKELLQSFFALYKKHPEKNLKLVFVGEATRDDDGTRYEAELHDLVKTSGLQAHIRFAGFRKNIPEVMASLDTFVLASYKEAFGFVVVEALASRTPVIATRSGGVPDILDHGKYGLLVEPQNEHSIFAALEQVLLHRDESLERARQAREYARNQFDENKVYEKLIHHLETLR